MFERSNFIIKLDHYVWKDSCKTIRHWIDNNIEPIPVSINISPIHFSHPGFVNKLISLTEQFKISPKYLKLEFAEITFSENNSDIKKILEQLSEAGLDKNVIAEGVETIEQANNLLHIGCDFAQGFFFAKPIPLREFDELRAKVLSSNYTPSVVYPTFNDNKDLLP